MPRKGPPTRRPVVPDLVYHSKLVTQLINQILQDGKKSVAERIVYGSFEELKKKGMDPISTFKSALENTRPLLKVKPRRVGGATYQVPVEVPAKAGATLAIRWLVGYAKQRKGRSMTQRLSAELTDAANGIGAAVKKKEDTHKMAEANRAFAHYRW